MRISVPLKSKKFYNVLMKLTSASSPRQIACPSCDHQHVLRFFKQTAQPDWFYCTRCRAAGDIGVIVAKALNIPDNDGAKILEAMPKYLRGFDSSREAWLAQRLAAAEAEHYWDNLLQASLASETSNDNYVLFQGRVSDWRKVFDKQVIPASRPYQDWHEDMRDTVSKTRASRRVSEIPIAVRLGPAPGKLSAAMLIAFANGHPVTRIHKLINADSYTARHMGFLDNFFSSPRIDNQYRVVCTNPLLTTQLMARYMRELGVTPPLALSTGDCRVLPKLLPRTELDNTVIWGGGMTAVSQAVSIGSLFTSMKDFDLKPEHRARGAMQAICNSSISWARAAWRLWKSNYEHTPELFIEDLNVAHGRLVELVDCWPAKSGHKLLAVVNRYFDEALCESVGNGRWLVRNNQWVDKNTGEPGTSGIVRIVKTPTRFTDRSLCCRVWDGESWQDCRIPHPGRDSKVFVSNLVEATKNWGAGKTFSVDNALDVDWLDLAYKQSRYVSRDPVVTALNEQGIVHAESEND